MGIFRETMRRLVFTFLLVVFLYVRFAAALPGEIPKNHAAESCELNCLALECQEKDFKLMRSSCGALRRALGPHVDGGTCLWFLMRELDKLTENCQECCNECYVEPEDRRRRRDL